MKTNRKLKLASILLITSILPISPGCTDAEIAAVIGGAVIGGAIAGGAARHHRQHHRGYYECRGGFRNVCHEYTNYFGYRRVECHSEYDSCVERVFVPQGVAINEMIDEQSESTMDLTTSDSKSEKLSETKFAQIFELSFESSEKLIQSLELAKLGDLKPILNLGLSREDVTLLVQFQMPTEAGIDQLAKTLNQAPQATKAMIEKILIFAKSEREKNADFRSRR